MNSGFYLGFWTKYCIKTKQEVAFKCVVSALKMPKTFNINGKLNIRNFNSHTTISSIN